MLVAEFLNVNSVITVMENNGVSKCVVTQLTSCYFENLSHTYKLFFEDVNYRVALHGSGFDHKWSLVCFSPEQLKIEDDFYMEMDDDGDGHMIFVNRFAMATESRQDSRNDNVILHLVECSATGLFYLEVDDIAQELLKVDGARFSACDSTVPVKMTDGYQKLVLSGKLFLDRWRINAGRQFVLMYQLSRFHSSTTDRSEVEPCALKTLPGLVLDAWPSGASKWPTISRAWLSDDVVREASRQNVYSVPVMSVVVNSDTATDSENHGYLWMLDFGDAEEVLTRHLTEFQSQVFHHFRKIYWQKHPCKHRVLFRNLQLKHTFFWTLEANTGTAWKEKDVAKCVIEICQTFLSFLEKKHFPHYFMPKFDLLTFDTCGLMSCLASCSDQTATICTMMEHCQSECVPSSIQSNTIDKFEKHARDQIIQFKLADLFEQSASLLFMQLYQKLHTASTIDESIRRHLDALTYIEKMCSCCNHIMPVRTAVQAWVTASLGVKYLLKMKSSSDIDEIGKLREQANECLKKSVILAPRSETCATALAMFLFLTDQRAEVVSCLKHKLPGHVSSSSGAVTNVHEGGECGTQSDFSKEFSDRWIESSDKVDFTFSHLEQPVLSLLPGLWETLDFIRCQVLGVTSPSSDVFAISAEFLSDILLILALIAEKRTEEALTILRDQEKKLLKQSKNPVLGDKKLIANYFVLAAVYSQLHRKEDVLRLLKSSRNIFRNPRNPALSKLFTIYASRFKRYMGVAVPGLFLLITSVFAAYAGWLSKRTFVQSDH